MKLRNKLHGTALALSLFLLLGTATACGSDNNSDSSEKDSTTTAAKSSDETTANDASSDSETASSDGLTFVITLYPDDAPITCENFENLVSDGFYDGLTFHRIVEDFMAQGGDPSGNGTGGSEKTIKGEFSQNGFKNDLKHTEGVLSMARSMMPDSAGSQFFIMHKKAPHLDGAYAAFGKITEGMDVVNKIAETATDYSDRPLEKQIMKKVTVETFGEDYPEPETV